MKYYEISEETARRAQESFSFRDYSPGSATAEYRAAVDAAAELAEQHKARVSSYYHDRIDAALDRYAKRLAEWTNAHNRNIASCPSVLISGASNFPVNKKRKQNAREDSLWQEYREIEAIRDKITQIGTGPVELTDPHAREILQDKLEKLQKQHEHAKTVNAHWRKHKTFRGLPGVTDESAAKLDAQMEELNRRFPHSQPYPDYELTSLRDKIKRTKARLADLDQLETLRAAQAAHKTEPVVDGAHDVPPAAAGQNAAKKPSPSGEGGARSVTDEGRDPTTIPFDGGTIYRNAELNRLQILFDSIPDADTRSALKGDGFRWSPKNQAWQRQLTPNAERAARRILHL